MSDNTENKKEEYAPAYVEISVREEDMKSSGLSFLVVGILLLAASILIYIEVLPFGSTPSQRIINTIIVAVFGICFLLISVFSYRRAKQLNVSAVQEEKLTEEIIQYCLSNYEEPDTTDAEESDIFFLRENVIRKMISAEFKGMSDSYVDYLLDIIYSELYPETEE